MMYGNYPTFCSVIPDTEVLDLSRNRFEGDWSGPGIQACKKLTVLRVADNFYEGGITSELGALTNLRELDFSGNADMSGTIPTELGGLSNFQFLNAQGTRFYGTVPDKLCERAALGDVQVLANCSAVECCK